METVELITGRFFCHSCGTHQSVVSVDYKCFLCASGFIETVEPSEQPDDHVEPSNSADSRPRENTTSQENLNPTYVYDNNGERNGIPRLQITLNGLNRINDGIHLAEEIMSLLDSTPANAVNQGAREPFIIGDPANYAWGHSGFDSIVTQLLNQLDSSGPPPLSKEKINDLPVIEVSSKHVEANMQCSVCWDNFVLSENVRQLPCCHIYHDKCIIPWLELRASCPICRKVLNDATSSNNNLGSTSASGTANRSSEGNAENSVPDVTGIGREGDISNVSFSDASWSVQRLHSFLRNFNNLQNRFH